MAILPSVTFSVAISTATVPLGALATSSLAPAQLYENAWPSESVPLRLKGSDGFKTSARTAFRQADMENALARLALLGDDWDAYGGKAPTGAVLANASAVAHFLSVAGIFADVDPNPNGTVSFHFSIGSCPNELEVGSSRYAWSFDQADGDVVATVGEIRELDMRRIEEVARSVRGQERKRRSAA